MKRIGIIGGARFGAALAESLARQGAEVILLDEDIEIVQRLADDVSKAVQGDATDLDVLREAGFQTCDAVVVGIGSNIEGSVLAVMNLKELKVPQVIAKAGTDMHGKVLERLGADLVVYPNKERAQRLARALMAKSALDYFEVAEGVSVVEMRAPASLVGKSLADADIRRRYGLNVLVIKRLDAKGRARRIVSPSGDDKIQTNDTLLVFGPNDKINAMVD